MQIGQIIRSLREEKGWSQEKLALEAGMATSHLSRIERGRAPVADHKVGRPGCGAGHVARSRVRYARGIGASASRQ
jgi:hypothetical protein